MSYVDIQTIEAGDTDIWCLCVRGQNMNREVQSPIGVARAVLFFPTEFAARAYATRFADVGRDYNVYRLSLCGKVVVDSPRWVPA